MIEVSKILHGGRLSSVREDVAKFTSSRKDDNRLATAVVDINKVHVIMLMEQKIIQWQDGAKILKALSKQSSVKLDPSAEDVHMAVEEAVLKETGPEVGGNLHIGKSRNDQVTTAIRMQLRNELVQVLLKVLEMQESLIDTASKHVETVILEYTHLQAAQPVTFAHYLLSHVQGLERDLERLQGAYERVNLCPLGAGALATTSFPIKRKRTAALLGFKAVLENSIDAVGSRDFILETQAALTLLAVNLSRLAEDLIIWSSQEFGTVELPDDFTSTSSIMPQKKNPEVLEVIRARASYALGDFVASVAALKSLPSTYNLDFQEVTPKLWASTDNLASSLSIFSQLVPNLKVSTNVASKAGAGFVGATELANMLVCKYNIAFRTSHKIVGALVKSLIDAKQNLVDATPELMQKVAQQAVGIELMVKKQDMVECTNPRKIIETYKVQGGPSRVEVERAITAQKKNMVSSKKSISKLKQNLAYAENTLNSIVESYSLSNSELNVRLKNPDL
ncbi:MAG: argininosuccinate lyase [Candidatus Bathyarchaeia archaeon]